MIMDKVFRFIILCITFGSVSVMAQSSSPTYKITTDMRAELIRMGISEDLIDFASPNYNEDEVKPLISQYKEALNNDQEPGTQRMARDKLFQMIGASSFFCRQHNGEIKLSAIEYGQMEILGQLCLTSIDIREGVMCTSRLNNDNIFDFLDSHLIGVQINKGVVTFTFDGSYEDMCDCRERQIRTNYRWQCIGADLPLF